MQETKAIIEFTQDEMTALGLVLALWRAERSGLNLRQAILLATALEEVDSGVFQATIDRITLRMAKAEDEVFDKVSGLFDDEELRDKRAALESFLDQVFADFEEEGRRLFPT
jgi:predicted DNA-binding transcriptional regulator YafY